MNKWVILAFAVVGLVASSQARAEVFSALLSSPGDSPRPIPGVPGAKPVPAPGFKFDEGKAFWDKALIPTESGLLGKWIMVGYADVDLAFANMKNAYDPNGIKNSDGSVFTLAFASMTNPVTSQKILSVEFTNTGIASCHQGPYESSIDPTTSSAVASLFANGGQNKTYFRFDCRASPSDADQMVCALTLKVDPSELATGTPNQSKYNNVMGGITILQRVH